ncbi:hypothetical protein TVAG_341250 [Trichomonas vaginalis G3]|uniref:RRM domain-containing protein n=1 Tax=Trichomonas vaginalis (strain ATCC PRA-98 / G3) TaxID=412133 RepID=A2DTT4_TRIV3|nr:RNA-binding domain, RBD family-containing protein [Trichomonas vaginalis G3]EAY16231.1 hypothetical protein TVAG_341250 [Trichomonas vaginalis G3]KAI5493264.1 RNA-binding domain, RBD family-containing protein [Trichomonas vaginalis G3]|eukprot:XP_001328454.1 hypothetical protein [Trichomonas vaginalis G3]
MLSNQRPQKDYTKSSVLVISNIPDGSTSDDLWHLFSVLCGSAFLAVKFNNSESYIAVFINVEQARLAQKALEFIIFKNHILTAKGLDFQIPPDTILHNYFQVGNANRIQKSELVNKIPANKTIAISYKQITEISKMRKSRKMLMNQDKYGSDNENYEIIE